MTVINRKQIPLCAEQHKALYNNTLFHDERELLEENIQLLKKDSITRQSIFSLFYLVYD